MNREQGRRYEIPLGWQKDEQEPGIKTEIELDYTLFKPGCHHDHTPRFYQYSWTKTPFLSPTYKILYDQNEESKIVPPPLCY